MQRPSALYENARVTFRADPERRSRLSYVIVSVSPDLEARRVPTASGGPIAAVGAIQVRVAPLRQPALVIAEPRPLEPTRVREKRVPVHRVVLEDVVGEGVPPLDGLGTCPPCSATCRICRALAVRVPTGTNTAQQMLRATPARGGAPKRRLRADVGLELGVLENVEHDAPRSRRSRGRRFGQRDAPAKTPILVRQVRSVPLHARRWRRDKTADVRVLTDSSAPFRHTAGRVFAARKNRAAVLRTGLG